MDASDYKLIGLVSFGDYGVCLVNVWLENKLESLLTLLIFLKSSAILSCWSMFSFILLSEILLNILSGLLILCDFINKFS